MYRCAVPTFPSSPSSVIVTVVSPPLPPPLLNRSLPRAVRVPLTKTRKIIALLEPEESRRASKYGKKKKRKKERRADKIRSKSFETKKRRASLQPTDSQSSRHCIREVARQVAPKKPFLPKRGYSLFSARILMGHIVSSLSRFPAEPSLPPRELDLACFVYLFVRARNLFRKKKTNRKNKRPFSPIKVYLLRSNS